MMYESAEMSKIIGWRPSPNAPIWEADGIDEPQGPFFRDLNIRHQVQSGPTCVLNTLSQLARASGFDVGPEHFMGNVNTQSPHSWSKALEPFGMQLAYCNTDLRRLEYYIDELVELDDLFLVSFYSADPPYDPDSTGKLVVSHIVTLHRDEIIDTAKSGSFGICEATEYPRLDQPTKRIFRVVPAGHPRAV
jgi:hypothetical protein